MIRILILNLLLCITFSLPAQIVQEDGSTRDQSELYASTKQVNQFFRRFNGEEDQKGKRFYESDKEFREASLRKNYLSLLFDRQNQNISSEQKKSFINDVTDKRNPKFLDFHQEGWFAEVNKTSKQNKLSAHLQHNPPNFTNLPKRTTNQHAKPHTSHDT